MSHDAVVLGVGPAARNVVCGLRLVERARRMLARSGAARVIVVDSAAAVKQLGDADLGARDLLIVRASDQVVHNPLIDAVAGDGVRIAVDPTSGAYAGAIRIPGGDAGAVAELRRAVEADPEHGDVALAKRWLAEQRATPCPHGDIARHPATTRDERDAAARMLFRLVHKPQDGSLSKYLFRPVSGRITTVLLPTPITPNHVTYFCAVLALTGCWIASGPSYWDAVIGSFMAHVASYFDCTDGEIARLRHEGSKLGMWLDTIADEATTIFYLVGIGYHVYQNHPYDWVAWTIPIGFVGSLVALYVIYYYLIVVLHSGNSQDYPKPQGGPFEPLAELLHRDFIGLACFLLAVCNLTEVAYGVLFVGAVVSAFVLGGDHIKLRRQRRTAARA